MLKFLFTSRCSLRVLSKSVAYFSQPFAFKEQEFLSDGESDQESKATLTQFDMYSNFSHAQTPSEVIKVYNENNLTFEEVHFAAFQLTNIVKERKLSPQELEEMDKFITENIIANFEKLNPQQAVTIFLLFIRINNKRYSASIKKHIEANLRNFSYLQLPYIFQLYSKNGWNSNHIGRLLKKQLQSQTFTAHALCQIIRGCYIEQVTVGKSIDHADLAFNACKQLDKEYENLNFHGQVAVFNQMARLKLNQRTSFKRYPPLLGKLADIFLQNISKLSLHSKLKLLDSYSYLPSQFPKDLFEKIYYSLESESISSALQLKLYIILKQQPQWSRPNDTQMKRVLGKIKWEDVTENNFLIKFLDIEFDLENKQIIEHCCNKLLKAQNLSQKQRIEVLKVMIKHNKLEEAIELIQIEDNYLVRLIDQAYLCHRSLFQVHSEQVKENVNASVRKIIQKIEALEPKARISICHYILKLDPYKDDPFYEFLFNQVEFEKLPQNEYLNFLLRLNSKIYYDEKQKKMCDQLAPSPEQLANIINNISNYDFLNDRLVRQISQWLYNQIDKSIIDESLNVSAALTLLFKIVVNCQLYQLHNMRGTLIQPLRDVILLMDKQVHITQKPIDIDVQMFCRFSRTLAQTNFRTLLISNVCEKVCQNCHSLSDFNRNDIATIITEQNVHQFHQVKHINKFFDMVLNTESDSYNSTLVKTKIYLYQLKNQARLGVKGDDVQVKIIVEQLRDQILLFNLTSQIKSDKCLDGLMTLLDYDGWRMNHVESPNDGLQDFIQLQFETINEHLTMKSMRYGLKQIIRSALQYNTKHLFIKRYKKLFQLMFQKCRDDKNKEKPHVQACLDYIEFAKKLKINDKSTLEYLVNQIIEQADNLKQVQIVDAIQKLSEQKMYFPNLFNMMSDMIQKKINFFSNIELADVLSALVRIGHFDWDLSLAILNKLKTEDAHKINLVSNVQSLWSVLLILHEFKVQKKQDLFEKHSKLIEVLMKNFLKFITSESQNNNMALVYRQTLDIHNLLEFSFHLDLPLNQINEQLSKQIVQEGKRILQSKLLSNQKLNLQSKQIMQFLDEKGVEYKANYFLDSQYVDFYIPSQKLIVSVDNSLYVTHDMQQYTGFHYFNVWILEGAAKKYELKTLRIKAAEWMEMDDSKRKKILQM